MNMTCFQEYEKVGSINIISQTEVDTDKFKDVDGDQILLLL